MYKDINGITKYINPDGSMDLEVNIATQVNAINNSIKNILLTPKGSVPGKPYFGSDLHKIAFEQMDFITERLAERYTSEALSRFEDRIKVLDIIVENIEAYNRVVITVNFAFRDEVGRVHKQDAALAFDY